MKKFGRILSFIILIIFPFFQMEAISGHIDYHPVNNQNTQKLLKISQSLDTENAAVGILTPNTGGGRRFNTQQPKEERSLEAEKWNPPKLQMECPQGYIFNERRCLKLNVPENAKDENSIDK